MTAPAAGPALWERATRIRALGAQLQAEVEALELAARPLMEADGGPPVGHTLRARRLALGLSQRALARRVGYSRSLVADLEAGRRGGGDALQRYSAALTQAEQLRDIEQAKRLQRTTDTTDEGVTR